MNRAWIFAMGLVCAAAAIALPWIGGHLQHAVHGHGSPEALASERVHTEERFSFVALGPLERVAPLFGAHREGLWSPDWNPQFVYPAPASDLPGMVFQVEHGRHPAVWVNTEFDLKEGRVQYVYIIPDSLVTVIRLRLTPEKNTTRVDVEYDRTALSPEADSHVRHMAEGDRVSGPEWEKQVNEYLGKKVSSTR
jgi:hypothetical protein